MKSLNYYRVSSRKTAYLPRVYALKMEETKLATDTLACESKGREAFCMGRSFCVSSGGPYRIEDPAVSNSIVV